MVFTRTKLISSIVGLVILLAFVYGGFLAFGPGAKYRGLKTSVDITMDDETRSFLTNRLKTSQAAIEAQKANGEEVNLNLYLSVASDAFSLGDLVTAREALEAQLKANAAHYGAWNSYGKVLEQMGDYKKARDAYEMAIETSSGKGPDSFYGDLVSLLRVHFVEEPDAVKAALEQSVATHGQNSWNMVELGRWYKAAGDCIRAIDHYKVAKSLSPNNTALLEEYNQVVAECK